MKVQLNDEELIRQHLKTNPNVCFEALYNRYVGKVYKRCLSLTKDVEKAEDFTHDIFIRAFARLDRFQERSTFSTWLYSISFNYCMDQIKVSNRLLMTTLEDNVINQYTDSNEPDEERVQYLTRALESMTPQESTLLRMKYQQGLDIQQIANQFNLKESAVKMRLKRSRDKVRQFYIAAAN
ncbi:RNA polymerase sigma factor [Spirosoma pollinicola]|uniref:RNA polymerase subunit sigma-24 n=1 Tax=Spirosoma pollinicola TaxID=2057025 RepID=A0A2K8YSM5_9BACT|nr:sigma-70 family RNA polymerase sigma factor [Spirosoma pollinicola]AUD00642.1 RNA polymerase subunit sigma-24 [Spirosoma pollinicola]